MSSQQEHTRTQPVSSQMTSSSSSAASAVSPSPPFRSSHSTSSSKSAGAGAAAAAATADASGGAAVAAAGLTSSAPGRDGLPSSAVGCQTVAHPPASGKPFFSSACGAHYCSASTRARSTHAGLKLATSPVSPQFLQTTSAEFGAAARTPNYAENAASLSTQSCLQAPAYRVATRAQLCSLAGGEAAPPTAGFFSLPALPRAAASRATVAMYCATYAACTSAGGASAASASAFAAAAEGPDPGVATGGHDAYSSTH